MLKKMCPKPNPAPKTDGAELCRTAQSGVASALQYTMPVYRETESCSYIEFYAFDPEQDKLRRKRIKTNRIKGVGKRRQYVRDVMKRIGDQLQRGWNPWVAKDTADLYTFEEALGRYESHIEKMVSSESRLHSLPKVVSFLAESVHSLLSLFAIYEQANRRFIINITHSRGEIFHKTTSL